MVKTPKGIVKSLHRFYIKTAFSTRVYAFQSHANLDLRDYYEIGEKVTHYAGYAIPAKAEPYADEAKICIECGELFPPTAHSCCYCGKYLR